MPQTPAPPPRSRRRGRRLGALLTAATAVGAVAAIALPDVQTSAGAAPAGSAAAAAAPVSRLVTVSRVVDGDTIEINGRPDPNIRLIGLNAMETGECRARQATRRLAALAEGESVLLTARDRNSTTAGPRQRPRRSIALRDAGGAWTRDPAATLVYEGLAIWFPNRKEYDKNQPYAAYAVAAAQAHRGLWNPDGCGAGPSSGAQLKVTVDWQGAEAVAITNVGAMPVDLGGWWLRDSLQRCGKRGVPFAAGTVLPAGGTTTVDPRTARCGNGRLAWRGITNVFAAPSAAPVSMGDGAYLFDPDGDIRAAHMFGPENYQHLG